MNIRTGLPQDVPPSNAICEIAVCEFDEAALKFSERYLRGAVFFTSECDSQDALGISPELTAHMFRLMVLACERRALLSVRSYIDFGHYTWRVDFGTRQPNRTVLYKIKAVAEESGFIYRECGNTSILLTAKLKQRKVLSIYAASRKDAEDALVKTFFTRGYIYDN